MEDVESIERLEEGRPLRSRRAAGDVEHPVDREPEPVDRVPDLDAVTEPAERAGDVAGLVGDVGRRVEDAQRGCRNGHARQYEGEHPRCGRAPPCESGW